MRVIEGNWLRICVFDQQRSERISSSASTTAREFLQKSAEFPKNSRKTSKQSRTQNFTLRLLRSKNLKISLLGNLFKSKGEKRRKIWKDMSEEREFS